MIFGKGSLWIQIPCILPDDVLGFHSGLVDQDTVGTRTGVLNKGTAMLEIHIHNLQQLVINFKHNVYIRAYCEGISYENLYARERGIKWTLALASSYQLSMYHLSTALKRFLFTSYCKLDCLNTVLRIILILYALTSV